jgi:hypothetical protein
MYFRNVSIFLVTLFSLLVVVHFGDHSVSANTTYLRHAYKPYLESRSQDSWLHARINNLSSYGQTRLVCAEAYKHSTNKKTHLGCTWLSFDAYKMGNWGTEFSVPVYRLTSPGAYTVVYNYQDSQGDWHKIWSMTLTSSDGHYHVW